MALPAGAEVSLFSQAPAFWWRRPDWRVWALYPVSTVYGAIAWYRMVSARREKLALPVLCVGNFTLGGTGKTPVAMALAGQAVRMGLKPGFLSRGHGGNISHPHIVDPSRDEADDVGDEPLLLARCATVAIAADRAAGARLLIEQGCDFLIMDDGFQSAHIHMDYALVVVDGARGVGNGHVFPGGALRAPLQVQLSFADALLKMGEGAGADGVVGMAVGAGKPVFKAVARPRDIGTIEQLSRERERFCARELRQNKALEHDSFSEKSGYALAGRRFLAFAGIGHPEKFFDSVRATGGEVVVARAFPDHHFYTGEDIAELERVACSEGLELITTAKDSVRLEIRQNGKAEHDATAARVFSEALTVLEIDVVFANVDDAERIIGATVAAWKERTSG